MKKKPSVEALADVAEVDCTMCGQPMHTWLGSGGRVRYFRCGSCMRWISSSYADVLTADAKFRARRVTPPPVAAPSANPATATVRASVAVPPAEQTVRAPQPEPLDSPPAMKSSLRAKLERWLSALDDRDPYRALGVSPLDSEERIKSRYRELALQRHPDRGGNPEEMSALNRAYERILEHRRQSAIGEPLGAG